jgi:hypothetical protein
MILFSEMERNAETKRGKATRAEFPPPRVVADRALKPGQK